MKEELFRKKSIERIKSPESLNDYVRVANPSVWIVLAAVILLLVGACIWGVFGQIESTVPVTVTVAGGTATGSVAEEKVETGMTIRVGSAAYTVESVSLVEQKGRLFYTVTFSSPLDDGTYQAELVTGIARPFSFLLN